MESWDLRSQFQEAVKAKGGWVNCHGHFDKSYFISKKSLAQSMVTMETKWRMSDDIKKNSTQAEVEERIRRVLDSLIEQGGQAAMSFIDAYDVVGHKNIDAANKVKEEYKDKIKFYTAPQPLGGLNDKKARDLYEEITAKMDFAGGLPSFDRPDDDNNYDYLFSIAKNLGKHIHIHIDQENNPHERDTEKLIKYTKKYGYEGKVTAIHVLSVSAQPKEYRQKIYRQMADLGMNVIVCPTNVINMTQLDQYTAPIHNSIANVPEMLDAGLLIALGTDDIADFYNPFCDADMWIELRALADACRYFDFDKLVDIATVNGRKILELVE
ncbi:amidohydrolase family protein [Patescibacteria group bacterium]|nr:amidohydrolase family protein [Patescibacteria group bacterium]